MIMGFPGSTNRYLTQSEVKQRMHSTNEPRIRIRGVRQDVLKKEMAASDKYVSNTPANMQVPATIGKLYRHE